MKRYSYVYVYIMHALPRGCAQPCARAWMRGYPLSLSYAPTANDPCAPLSSSDDRCASEIFQVALQFTKSCVAMESKKSKEKKGVNLCRECAIPGRRRWRVCRHIGMNAWEREGEGRKESGRAFLGGESTPESVLRRNFWKKQR